MATTYTPHAALRKPALGDRNWHIPLLENCDLLDDLAAVGPLAVRPVEIPSASLNVAVAAGNYRKADGTVAAYAGATSFAVTASGTRYLYLTDGGTLTDGAAWPSSDHVRLAIVVTGATTITSVTDARIPWQSFGAGGGTALQTSGGTMLGDLTLGDGINIVVNTATGSKIGTSAAQKIAFFNATPVSQPASANQVALIDLTGGSVANSTLGEGSTTTALTVLTGGTSSTTLAAITLPSNMGGSTGGTADGSWQTIPAPNDSPASADALRDDLEANVLAAIRNNLAEVATELATVRAALSVLRDSVRSLGDQANAIREDQVVANDNAAKIAKLVNAIRSALVSLGLIKGSD